MHIMAGIIISNKQFKITASPECQFTLTMIDNSTKADKVISMYLSESDLKQLQTLIETIRRDAVLAKQHPK